MYDNLEWVYRPVIAKMVSFESLKNGTVDLADIAEMNEALDVDAENQFRFLKNQPGE